MQRETKIVAEKTLVFQTQNSDKFDAGLRRLAPSGLLTPVFSAQRGVPSAADAIFSSIASKRDFRHLSAGASV